jgi:membrane protein DedA with SNARE-associated domain
VDLAELFTHYGYLMLLVGSLGEGMPIMLFGGFAAHRGWLALIPWVIVIGAIGNAVAQGVWFVGARSAGHSILEKRPEWAANGARRPNLRT